MNLGSKTPTLVVEDLSIFHGQSPLLKRCFNIKTALQKGILALKNGQATTRVGVLEPRFILNFFKYA